MVLVGVRTGGSLTEFVVRAFFPTPVIAWQLLRACRGEDDIYTVHVADRQHNGRGRLCGGCDLEGRHLVHTTLAEFEASLDPARFLRVHRSRIVNLHQVVWSLRETGACSCTLQNQETIQTSRAGAKLVLGRVY